MLFLNKIVQKSDKLSNSERLTLYIEFFIDRFRFQSDIQYLFICFLAYKPIDIFKSDSKWLQFGILEFILLLIYHFFELLQSQIKLGMIAPIKSESGNVSLDPILILTQQLKDKNLKKQAIEQIGTIALVLSSERIRQQLVPLLIKTFVQENLEMRVVIVKSFAVILEYISTGNQSFVLFEFILDVLCVFSQEQLRKPAYQTLQAIIQCLNLRRYQGQVIKVIKQLGNQNQKNIKGVILKLVRYLYTVAEGDNETYLIELLHKYSQAQEDQLLLAQQISEFIKIMPPFPQSQIHSIMKILIKSESPKVRSKLIEPLILLTKILDEQSTKEYFQILLNDTSTDVIASLITQINKIKQLPSKNILNQILKMIDNQEKHDSTIRSAILDVLQYIPLTQERRSYILQSNFFKSLSLSKALADSLCKIHDIQALAYLIEISDTEFKNKLFPKLPSACQIHVKLMEHILNQKNWRSKLTLLQNIEKRMENQENVEIFIPKLLEQLGDKIGVLRLSVVRLIALIIKSRKLELKGISGKLYESFQSKNWFEKQSVLLLMEQLASNYKQFEPQSKIIFRGFVNQGLNSNIENIRSISLKINSKLQLQ